ncbi:hypothetical protein ACFWXA_37395 [Streptomyces atroolivaceus]|uniref:hypothetical protein n=1 Tax=Streptomyces atroolivaceus TaxID=66869 RepID=UPI003656848D
MPAEVLRDPLALKLSLPGERSTVIVIGDLPNPQLAADLTESLAALVHPHGPLAKLTTVKSFTYTLRRMVRELAEDGFTGSAAELTRAVLGAVWLRSHYLIEYRTRTILRTFDTRHQVLPESVRQMVFGQELHAPHPQWTATASSMPAARHRSRSSVHDVGRYRRRSISVRPRALA